MGGVTQRWVDHFQGRAGEGTQATGAALGRSPGRPLTQGWVAHFQGRASGGTQATGAALSGSPGRPLTQGWVGHFQGRAGGGTQATGAELGRRRDSKGNSLQQVRTPYGPLWGLIFGENQSKSNKIQPKNKGIQ